MERCINLSYSCKNKKQEREIFKIENSNDITSERELCHPLLKSIDLTRTFITLDYIPLPARYFHTCQGQEFVIEERKTAFSVS